MGYTAFGIELDDDGYPEWHRDRKRTDAANPMLLQGVHEYAAAYRVFQTMYAAAMAGILSKHDSVEMRIEAKRLHDFRKVNNIKIVVYKQVK